MAKELLDLHGCRSTEVMDKLDRFMMSATSSDLKRVRIMTGKGTGAVKKVVTEYLKQAQYPWKFEKLSNGKDNEGVLVVFLE